jgi:hypothetical protein
MVKGKIVASAAVQTPDIQSDTLIFHKMDNVQQTVVQSHAHVHSSFAVLAQLDLYKENLFNH